VVSVGSFQSQVHPYITQVAGAVVQKTTHHKLAVLVAVETGEQRLAAVMEQPISAVAVAVRVLLAQATEVATAARAW
jgi:hypothetical protein